MVEVSLDGSSDDAEVVVVSCPVLDGTLVWRFTDTTIQRILYDVSGAKISSDHVSWEEASEDLWFL